MKNSRARKSSVEIPATLPARKNHRLGLGAVAGAILVASVSFVVYTSAFSGTDPTGPKEETTPTAKKEEAPACCDPEVMRTNALINGINARFQMPPPNDKDANVPDAGKVEPTVVSRAMPPEPAPAGMVWIPPGKFSMGSAYAPFKDARPIHPVDLDGFWMDKYPVTNEQFAVFVKARGYVTVAEKKPNPKDFPDVPEDKLVAGSVVFSPPAEAVLLNDHLAWWGFVPGACWKHPEGPESNLKGRENHPVVHVCWEDAAAYAKWSGKRLPTEAEWEYAARGGLTQMPYVWGKEFRPGGKIMANTWQGQFPFKNTKEDGWERTSPVGSFPANGFGLYDMAGNVWQWCSDWYRPDSYKYSPRRNPQGPTDSFDPREPTQAKRVQRGGSFLCSDQYCSRYMPGGRGNGAVDTGSSHVGFRCVLSPKKK